MRNSFWQNVMKQENKRKQQKMKILKNRRHETPSSFHCSVLLVCALLYCSTDTAFFKYRATLHYKTVVPWSSSLDCWIRSVVLWSFRFPASQRCLPFWSLGAGEVPLASFRCPLAAKGASFEGPGLCRISRRRTDQRTPFRHCCPACRAVEEKKIIL